jgi:hypothetical protein
MLRPSSVSKSIFVSSLMILVTVKTIMVLSSREPYLRRGLVIRFCNRVSTYVLQQFHHIYCLRPMDKVVNKARSSG